MSRYATSRLAPDSRVREQAEQLARDAGEMGASRPPDEAFFGSGRDPSDSMILSVLQAFDAGQLVRREVKEDRASDCDYAAAIAEERLQTPEAWP